MAFGNVALALVAVFIARAGSFSRLDVLFWAFVGALVVARYVDVTRLDGLTADGQPASLRHWRRYSGALVAIAAGVWALAHFMFSGVFSGGNG